MKKVPPKNKRVKPKKKVIEKYFFPIYPGILDYLGRGDISYSQLGLYVTIHGQANFSTGLWWGSAPRLLNCGPRGAKLREVQRDLDRLVKVGLLKHFHKQGSRGNFSWIINKYVCRSGALRGMRLNADKSTALDALVYEPCADDALTTRSGRALSGIGPSHVQEVKEVEVKEVQELEKKTKPKASLPPEISQLLLELEQRLSGQLSGWGWWDDQTEPDLNLIHESFRHESRVQGIDWRKAEHFYNNAVAKVRKELEPAETIQHEPFTQELIDTWAAEAGNDPDVVDAIRDGGILTLVYATGIEEYHTGADEPYWFPFEDEARQEKTLEEEPVSAQAMPDAAADCPTDASRDAIASL